MDIYINKHYKKKDCECTNIVACIAKNPPDDNWTKAPASFDLSRYQQLYIQNEVAYYGFL